LLSQTWFLSNIYICVYSLFVVPTAVTLARMIGNPNSIPGCLTKNVSSHKALDTVLHTFESHSCCLRLGSCHTYIFVFLPFYNNVHRWYYKSDTQQVSVVAHIKYT